MVKAPPVPSSLMGTFLVSSGAALDFLLLRRSSLARPQRERNTPKRCACRSRCEGSRWSSSPGSTEQRPTGPTGRNSSLLAMSTRLRTVALHSSSFSAAGGKSRSSCTRARASTGAGDGESCVDCDALRLITALEGAPSWPRSRSPPPPAPRRVCWPSSSCEGRRGLFPGRRPGSPAGWRCSSCTT